MKNISKDVAISVICNTVSIISLLFASYLLMRMYCVMSFRIPTDSMTPALLPGDCVLASQLRHDRIDHGDIIFFHFPYPERWDSIANPESGRFYAKRCIGLPGETLEIRNGHYFIDGEKRDIGNIESQDILVERLKGIVSDSVARSIGICLDAWPGHEENSGWTVLNFGPLLIPSKGTTIEINARTWLLYKTLIEWETGTKKDSISQLCKEQKSDYTFRKNYYFVAGDNTEDSQDSRYWGLLPEDHIRAKGLFIWKSKDPETHKIRWDRIWKHL